MIIFFIERWSKNSVYLDIDPNETIIDILIKNKLLDLEILKQKIDIHKKILEKKKYHHSIFCNYCRLGIDSIDKIIIYVIDLDINSKLKDSNIKEYSLLIYNNDPLITKYGGPIDNIKNEIDLKIGFDMNLIKRNELYVNLIHFDSNITNSENYEYFNNFKVDVEGGFYAIDDINIFRCYLEKIKEKKISFIVLCSGSSGKHIIFVKNILL